MYLDHAATTPMRPEAIAAVRGALDDFQGNASGSHSVARAAKNALEEAREQVAATIGAARADEIVFTGGGTEADNLAVVGAALATDRPGVVVSSIEHKAVVEPAESLERFGKIVRQIAVDAAGVVDLAHAESLMDPGAGVVSVMAANNETGVVQPVADIVELAKKLAAGAVVHTDAVQAIVGQPVDVNSLGVDLLTIAAHKFGGPKGVGALYVRSGTQLEPLIRGGGHEAGRRSGTSNVAGVVGMVAALTAAQAQRDHFQSVTQGERDSLEQALAERCGAIVTGAGADRLPHFAHVQLPGVSAESLLIRLDQSGVFAAAGSSCQSGAIEPSHVLTAMGMSPVAARECVRFTFGWDSNHGDGARAAEAIGAVAMDMVAVR